MLYDFFVLTPHTHAHMHACFCCPLSPGQSVVEHTQMSSDMFTQYLHHNYIEFFDAMDDVVRYALHTR